MVAESPYSISNGRRACALLLSRENPPPTAMICGNDVLALGALIECTAKGMEIPGDISVVGFDNLEYAMHSNPPSYHHRRAGGGNGGRCRKLPSGKIERKRSSDAHIGRSAADTPKLIRAAKAARLSFGSEQVAERPKGFQSPVASNIHRDSGLSGENPSATNLAGMNRLLHIYPA